MPNQRPVARSDLYSRVTSQILGQLERGVRPWVQPWASGTFNGGVKRPLRFNGEPYRGINVLMLWGAATVAGYRSPTWMTFKQALALGGCVRKEETGQTVVYADRFTRTDEGDGADGGERSIPFLKEYKVFNVDQVEGLPGHFYAPEPPPLVSERIERAEAFFAATGADIRHGGDLAFYIASLDHIQMPPFSAFPDAGTYYATLAHELIHWTRAPTRLDRDFGRQRFGDAGYATEELVAELGAAFIGADLALSPEPRDDHASYLAHWIAVLKSDNRAIFTAASHAQKAADYLFGLQPQPVA